MIWQELVLVGSRAAQAVMSQLETYIIWREIWPARVWQGDSLAPTWPGMFSDLVQNQEEAIQTPLFPYPHLQYPPRWFKRHQFVIHTTLSENFCMVRKKLVIACIYSYLCVPWYPCIISPMTKFDTCPQEARASPSGAQCGNGDSAHQPETGRPAPPLQAVHVVPAGHEESSQHPRVTRGVLLQGHVQVSQIQVLYVIIPTLRRKVFICLSVCKKFLSHFTCV